MKHLLIFFVMAIWLTACTAPAAESTGMGMPGMGPDSGMMQRHHATVPDAYAALQSPDVEAAMLQKGGEVYAASCASCHGDGGMGDGPAAGALDPVPAPLSHTSQMMSDGYLYWRVAEGGADFGSVMPAWQGVLSEQDIWSVIAYMRALGRGEVSAASTVGGATPNPDFEAQQHARMVAQAVEQKLITQAEADSFLTVHAEMDAYRAEHMAELPHGGADQDRTLILDKLVETGKLTRSQVDSFEDVHQKLIDAGLMQ
jgi:mono/diheme cytochrome c family protein